jgi:hypothetical protein
MTVIKETNLMFGHVRLEHHDGRVEHILRKESYDAVDAQASQKAAQLGKSVERAAEKQDEGGVARKPEVGPRKKRQSSTEAQ